MYACGLVMIKIRTTPFTEDETVMLCPFIVSLNLHKNPRQYLIFIPILQMKKLRCGNIEGHMFSQ